MARRGSAYGILAGMAVLANGLPLNSASSTSLACSNDAALQALRANLATAEPFCNSFVKKNAAKKVSFATETVMTTTTPGVTTVTQTSTVTPTLTISVADDFVVLQTTTVTRSACSSTAAAAIVTDPATSDKVAQTEGQAIPVRGGFVSVAAPAGHVVHEKRDPAESASEAVSDESVSTLPAYLSSFNADQVADACSCLQQESETTEEVVASSTTTVTSTVTATPVAGQGSTVTKVWTTVLPSAVVKLAHLGSTATVQVEACVTSPAAASS